MNSCLCLKCEITGMLFYSMFSEIRHHRKDYNVPILDYQSLVIA